MHIPRNEIAAGHTHAGKISMGLKEITILFTLQIVRTDLKNSTVNSG